MTKYEYAEIQEALDNLKQSIERYFDKAQDAIKNITIEHET